MSLCFHHFFVHQVKSDLLFSVHVHLYVLTASTLLWWAMPQILLHRKIFNLAKEDPWVLVHVAHLSPIHWTFWPRIARQLRQQLLQLTVPTPQHLLSIPKPENTRLSRSLRSHWSIHIYSRPAVVFQVFALTFPICAYQALMSTLVSETIYECVL